MLPLFTNTSQIKPPTIKFFVFSYQHLVIFFLQEDFRTLADDTRFQPIISHQCDGTYELASCFCSINTFFADFGDTGSYFMEKIFSASPDLSLIYRDD